jgi:ABC-type molybdate transport system substrate-binding protein
VIAIPPALTAFAECSIAVVQSTRREALAEAWVALVVSPEAHATLRDHGFALP